ncbi:unnamed protein product [Plutella xylostella]|uniref:(diamondback moth) hypothetical protein n=1 Tax=Plutella xylostella TaxID=51655 RepID=A0A8S4G089_PLUXY|nr:unnamed protein product [Plutella xylostella]
MKLATLFTLVVFLPDYAVVQTRKLLCPILQLEVDSRSQWLEKTFVKCPLLVPVKRTPLEIIYDAAAKAAKDRLGKIGKNVKKVKGTSTS